MAFSLFFFSNDTRLGLGKLFFIPTALAFGTSFFVVKKIGVLEFLFFLFVFFGSIPYIYYGTLDVQFSELPITRLVFGVLSCIALKQIPIKKIVKWLTLLTPFIVILHYLFSDLSEYRYGGFYGDPNYLAICFQILIVSSLLSINFFENKYIKFLGIINILSILPLILFGLSRAGIVTTIFILIFYFIFLIKNGNKSIYIYITLGILLLSIFSNKLISLFSNRIDDLFGRLNDLGGDVRNEINRIALEAFFTNENNIFFGFGIGNTETEKFLEITKYNNFRVHNSFIAVLVEQGIIGLLLIIFILSVLCYKILKSNNNLKIFRLGIFFTMLINLYSIYCFSFLGFWVMFFFLLNPWDDLKNNNL